MPILRGARVSLVCLFLFLLGTPILAQTVSLLDATGASGTYLENTRVRVRVVDASANSQPWLKDSVTVQLSTALAGDLEVLSLEETGEDTGVFEASRDLAQASTPYRPGILETALQAGPPVVRDTVTAQYGPATDTAGMAGARIQLLDDRGGPAAGYTQGDLVRIRVEDHVIYNDPGFRDAVAVAVFVSSVSDEELVSLQETGNATGIYEGTIPVALNGTFDDDGVVGGPVGDPVHGQYGLSDAQETVDAETPLVGSRAEILDGAGRYTDFVAESSTILLRAVDRLRGSPGQIDTAMADVSSELGGDSESVELVETGTDSGVYEGDLLTSIAPASFGNGRLETSEELGPPHRFDTITLHYISLPGDSFDTAVTFGSETLFVDEWGRDVEVYASGFRVYVRVADHNLGQSGVRDTVQATVRSLTLNDAETLTLFETGDDTHLYEGSLPLQQQPSGASWGDGWLQASTGETIEATHDDALGYTASADRAVVGWAAVGFVDERGRPTVELLEGGLARIRLKSTSAGSGPTTVDTASVTVRSGFAGDEELVNLTETGPDTGIYEGTVRLAFIQGGQGGPVPNNGTLETSNSGSPDYLGDTVTAEAFDATASAVTIGARIAFIDRFGEDAPSFTPGEPIGVRIEDHNLDDPQERQTVQALVVTNPETGDAEPVFALETGYATGVYEGFVSSRLHPLASPSNGTVEIQAGHALQARHAWAHASRMATDDAVATGSVVRFVSAADPAGQPVETYLEGDEVHLRLDFAAGNFVPYGEDIAFVQVSARLSGDIETVTLTETGADTGVFTGSIPLRSTAPSPYDGFVQVGRRLSPYSETDTLTVTHQGPDGTASDTASLLGSRTWFADAWGREVAGFARGSVAHVRVEDHNADNNPSLYETVPVTVRSLLTGDLETVVLLETARNSGVFAGSLQLSSSPGANPNDGSLQSSPGEEIEAEHVDWADGVSSDRAFILFSSVGFVDAAGEPTVELLEGGLARIQVFDVNSGSGTVYVQLASLYGGDLETSFALTETAPQSHVFEGTIPVLFVAPGSAAGGNGLLEVTTSGPPQYLGDEVTARFQDAEAQAVTVPSRVRFLDGFGREVSSFGVGERVGVRVEDHNRDDPQTRDSASVEVRDPLTGESETLSLLETGYDTNIFEGSILSRDGAAAFSNGTLEVHPGSAIEARYFNAHTPNPTVVQAVMAGSSVLFVDADGQPVATYLEASEAFVRVSDSFANLSPGNTEGLTVTLRTALGSDLESLMLNETGPDTGVFEGSIRLSISGFNQNDGVLTTSQDLGTPHEFDTLIVTHSYNPAGPVTATAGTISSRTWFVDANGELTDSYPRGSRAYIRVEDHTADTPGVYNTLQVTVRSLFTNDLETLVLQETAREGGIFEGSLPLSYESNPNPNDGSLQSNPGELIEAEHEDWTNVTSSTDRALILYSSVEFVGDVVEEGTARLRVFDLTSTGGAVMVQVQSRYGADQEYISLNETTSGSHVFEGTVQVRFVPPGGGSPNGLLDVSTSGSPEYLGDDLTATYQDDTATAVVLPSRVWFVDGFGRVVSTFGVGERVGVRVENHNLDDPQTRGTASVEVRDPLTGESEMLSLLETGYDTNIFEGTILSRDGVAAFSNGTLEIHPGSTIEARHFNAHTPNPTVAEAVMSGSSVLFVDAEGQPVATYLEASEAFVRVSDSFANQSPGNTEGLTVTLRTALGPDMETLTLGETGPDTGVFEGSIRLSISGFNQNDGVLTTSQDLGTPHEFDTLMATYNGFAGPVTATAGTISSRTWFVDANGGLADAYPRGSRAYIRVEDHTADSPGVYNTLQVTVRSLFTNDLETLVLQETAREGGIFEGSLPLSYESNPNPNDGSLQSNPGELIEAEHEDWTNVTSSTDRALILYSSVEFVGDVVEEGTARLRVFDLTSTGGAVMVQVQSRYGADQEYISLNETASGSHVFEGTVQVRFVPPGGGSPNGLLDVSTSGSPEYLGDDLTATYQDDTATAVVLPSRVWFIDGFGRVAASFGVGERVGVRVENHNLDDPQTRGNASVEIRDPQTGESEMLSLVETGYDTNVFEGSIASRDGVAAFSNGTLEIHPGSTIEARHFNAHTPNPTVVQAVMSGSSVLFVDAAGQPVETYLEASEAFVRVSDSFANQSPGNTEGLSVTVRTALGPDMETLTLGETGPDTGVFEGSIRLGISGFNQNDGVLTTSQDLGTPHEFDTLLATYNGFSGPVTASAGTISSRTWFIDANGANGEPTDSYPRGSRAYIRVEDHTSDSPGVYNTIQVSVRSLLTNDLETLVLQETAREGGIFEGSLPLSNSGSAAPNDGSLQSNPGEQIEASHQDWTGVTSSSDRASILFSSIEFVGAVVEEGTARLRVFDLTATSSVMIQVQSRYGADQESISLNETASGSHVFEGAVQVRFVPPGSGTPNGLLDVSTSGSPEYLGDDLTATYQDDTATAVVLPSRVWFIDSFGRVASTFGVGERVGVRVEDHNLDDPQTRGNASVEIRDPQSGESEMLSLVETGYDTNVFEGSIQSRDGVAAFSNGTLEIHPGSTIEARHFNAHTPNPTMAHAVMSGSSVLFVDADGQPVETYLEASEAFVRVSDSFANQSPGNTEGLSVVLRTALGPDMETLTLGETGPDTGVFEGSIRLSISGFNQNDGVLTTSQDLGTPHEFDTLLATYNGFSGPVTASAGTISSRTWFVDANGELTDSYPRGSRAYIRVEDHTSDSPGVYNTIQVTVRSLFTNDLETLVLQETAREGGIFEGSLPLSHPGSADPNDGSLQSNPGEQIEASHQDWTGVTSSTDRASILNSSVEFVGDVVEEGTARLRVFDLTSSGGVMVQVQSRYGADQEYISLNETASGSHVFEGTVQVRFVPPGGGSPNGLLDVSNSGSPEYLGDLLTATYQDDTATAVTLPSRVWFIDGFGRVASTFGVGERVGVRVEDHNLDDPQTRGNASVEIRDLQSGEAEMLSLVETGYDTNVFEGSIQSRDGVAAFSNGTLEIHPGSTIEARHFNAHTPNPTVIEATMTGSSVLFVDAAGQPVETYLEASEAFVRVSDAFANQSPGNTEGLSVTLRTALGPDMEMLTLGETGPDTGVFEGSIRLGISGFNQNDGVLTTSQDLGTPHEFDTLRATHNGFAGPVTATAGTISSRTGFVDANGAPADSYARGSRAYIRVEDHTADSPGVVNTIQVSVRSLLTNDLETLILQETALEGGIFEGSLPLSSGSATPNDGSLQSSPGEQIEASHLDWTGVTSSTDRASILNSSVEFVGAVLEDGTARLRVFDLTASSPVMIQVQSQYGADQEYISLTETASGSHVFEGTVAVRFVPPGGGSSNGLLDVSTSGSPEYLGDLLTASYQDDTATAVTLPSRAWFLGLQGQVVTQYAVGSTVRVRVENQSADTPGQVDSLSANLATPYDDEMVSLTETGTDTGVFEGSLPTSPIAGNVSDGTLQAGSGTVITLSHFNAHTPNPTQVYAAVTGNSVPLAVDDSAETAEQPVTISVLANDSDPDAETLQVVAVTQGANGTVVINASETVTYTPTVGFLGTDSFTYIAADPRGGEARATVTVTVVADNQAPTPSADVVTTPEDVAVNIAVLANDTDPDNDPLDVLGLGIPADGTAVLQPDDTITYTPETNWSGQTSFTYMVKDPEGLTAYATVTITVTPVNDPPLANADTATTNEDVPVTVFVLDNDSDIDGDVLDVLDVTSTTGVTNGIAVVNADNSITFTPAAEFSGTVSFDYAYTDGTAGGYANVTVTVNPVNDAPVAVDDTATVDEDSSVSVTVLANDTDLEGNPLDVTAVTQGADGSVAVNADDTVTYTPAANFHGTDSFTYTLSDGAGGTDTATVTMTVTSANDAPVAVDDTATVDEDASVSVSVLANDTDADEDTLAVSAVTQGTNGSVAIVGNQVTYTPAPNFNGADSFTYTVSDGTGGGGGTDTATVTMTVTASNDALTAVDDSATLAEDASVTIAVLANDTDPENDPLTIASVTQGTNGAVVVVGSQVTYTPNADFNGTDAFTYTASDGNGGTGGATVTVTVTPVNDAPVANDDAASVVEDGSVSISVLGDDTDVDGDTLSVASVTQGTKGAVEILGAQVVYTPAANVNGIDTFTYTVSDGSGGSDQATVTVTVGAANDAPAANADSATTAEDTAVTVSVLGNDTDLDGDTLSVASVTQGTKGAVEILGTQVVYTPAANVYGIDTFTYTVSDGAGGSGGTDTETVTITVTSVNDVPVAVNDAATVAEDGSVLVPVLANDTDADDDTLAVSAVTQGTNGSVAIVGNQVTYTPNADFHGTDSFTYTVSDGTPGNPGTDTATVAVTITPVNDAPVAVDDAASVVEDDSVAVSVLGNDSDIDEIDGDTLTITAVTQGANGAVAIAGDTVTYAPAPNFNGTDSFTYTVSDGTGGGGGTDTATVTMTVTASNDALTAVDDSATLAEDASVTVAVLANDTDPENDPLTIASVTQGTNGAVVIVGSQVTYTPNADFNGTDAFTYTASDGNGGTGGATVTVTVTPVNDAPVANDDAASVVEDGSVSISVLGDDTDVDGDTLSVASVTQGTKGAVEILGTQVVYTPAANVNGIDTFTYTISDGSGGSGGSDSATVTVTVGAANDAPVANADSATTAEDTAVTVSVLGNDTDLDGDTLSVASVTQGTKGAVEIVGTQVVYTPAANVHGIDTFTYTVGDGSGGTATATVTITVTSVNDVPVAVSDAATVAEDASVLVPVLANDTDADGDSLTVIAVTQGAYGSVTDNGGIVTYTPAANYNGPDSFTYTVRDGNSGVAVGTVTVTVTGTNDAPVAVNDSATVAEDGSATVPVRNNDTDADGDTLVITAVTQGAYGAVTHNGSTVTYVPAGNYNGQDAFTYTLADGQGGTATATVSMTVTAVNDPPVAVNDSASTLAEVAVAVSVRSNDTDVDGNTLAVTAVTQGAHGTVTNNSGLTVTYTPAAAWIGPDSFTYTISDGAGGTSTAMVSVTVQAPPRVAANLQVLYTFNEGSGSTVNDVSGVGTPLNLTIGTMNRVTWLPGALSLNNSVLVQSAGAATKVINACKASNEVTMEAWVAPDNATQTGPAVIAGIGQSSTKRNVTLGQSAAAYTAALRTSTTGQDGTQLNAAGTASTTLKHVVYTRSSTGAVRIYVNGVQVATSTLTGNLSTWASYNLTLGGEANGARYWIGDLHLVAIYSRALTLAEARQNWLSGAN